MTETLLRIGARGSPLSLAQTGWVKAALEAAPGNAGLRFEIVPIVTTGDRILDRRLIEAGGKGLFTRELDDALLEGRIDLAVHSMKDLPTLLPDGLRLVCTPEREDPRDALITRGATRLADLPAGSKVGTASLRRQSQILSDYPSLEIVTLRGNVDTRLRKVAEGEVDATLLALAGLKRLGLADRVISVIDPAASPPAAGQGALAITACGGDERVLRAVEPIDHHPTRMEISAERGFLAALDGSCRTPIAALGRWADGALDFVGEALTPDGKSRWRRSGRTACPYAEDASKFGAGLGEDLRAEAGPALYTD